MRAKRDLARPKKPLSAYIFFSQEVRDKMKAEHPEWNSTEIMKHVSSKWQHMSKEQKQPYNDLANKDKQRYDSELLNFTRA